MNIETGVAVEQKTLDQISLDRIIEQERTLVFDKFDNDIALELGMLYVNKAKAQKLDIVIDIRRHGQLLFHVALLGTTNDNAYWINGKNYIVNRFFWSSLRAKYYFKVNKDLFDPINFWGLTPRQAMGLVGGAFPIIVRGVGVIGTITCSGLADEDDHAFIVEGLKEYLKK
jgi:uncharacterized protein (UPF0303 family)